MFLLGYEITIGILLLKKNKGFLMKTYESLLHEFVWLNLSSFKDVMAGSITNLCCHNCFVISESLIGVIWLVSSSILSIKSTR